MGGRTKNTIRNVKTGFIVQLVNKLMAFVVRTVFIMSLNSEYLGINGLFTNVLTILSFAELGIGTAIIFNMYKPVAVNDKEKIKSLMKLYKTSYNIIGMVVFILGLLVIPLMDVIIKEKVNIPENINIIYLLFLIDTTSSYFFTYKKSIITAYQKQSIINNIDSVVYLIRSIVSILVLVFTKNYYLYLIIQIVFTVLENIYISNKANKMFPYLKETNVDRLEKEEKKDIFKNVKSLVVYKFGSVIMNGTDNILISSLINVIMVGLVSNYNLIITSIKSILNSALNGVIASIGNLNASDDKVKKEETYFDLTFVYFIIYSFCSIAFIILLNPFIEIWLTSKYVLGFSIALILGFNFFVEGMRQPAYIYRTTLGLFSKAQITPYIGAISNIILSIVLCKYMGLRGIFLATIISQLISYSWIDTFLIYKYEFKKSPKDFFSKYIKYFIVFIFELFITYLISKYIIFGMYLSFVFNTILVLIVPNILNIIIFRKTNEYKRMFNKFINPVLKKIKHE